MSKIYSNKTSDYLEWNQSMNLIRNLYNDGNYKMSLLISFGSFWGIRISDILSLKFEQVLGKDEFTIVEKKTKKTREIKINAQLKRHIVYSGLIDPSFRVIDPSAGGNNPEGRSLLSMQ